MPRYFSLCFAALATIIFSTSTFAQDADADKSPWSLDVEFGYVSTTGNTDTTNTKGKIDLGWETAKWKNRTVFESLNSEEDGQRTAEKYLLSNKSDYKLLDKDYLFAFESYEKDRFSGFEYQATIALGYGKRVFENDSMSLDVEAGPGYRINKFEEENADGDDDEKGAIVRAFGAYNWKISETAEFLQELSIEKGSDNTITKSSTSLKTTIIGQLAMKLSYTVKVTDEVPDGTDDKDTETTVTLLYSF